MSRIELAENSIKLLKDFVEIERTGKKVVTDLSKDTLAELTTKIIENIEKNIKEMKETN